MHVESMEDLNDPPLMDHWSNVRKSTEFEMVSVDSNGVVRLELVEM
jgi:hypothetical protein